MFSLAKYHDTLHSNGTTFHDYSNSLMIYPDNGARYRGVIVTSCGLHPYVNNYYARVTNGILNEVVLSIGQEQRAIVISNTDYSGSRSQEGYRSVSVPCTVNGIT